MFQAGFVVQLCSLVTTVAMSLMLFDRPWLLEGTRWSATGTTRVLSVSIVGGCFALRAWRELMAFAVPESPRRSSVRAIPENASPPFHESRWGRHTLD